MPRNLKTEERTKKPVRANALSLLGLDDVDLLTRSLARVANNSAISSTGDGTRTNMDNVFDSSESSNHCSCASQVTSSRSDPGSP